MNRSVREEKCVKRFERSNGLGTVLYKTYLLLPRLRCSHSRSSSSLRIDAPASTLLRSSCNMLTSRFTSQLCRSLQYSAQCPNTSLTPVNSFQSLSSNWTAQLCLLLVTVFSRPVTRGFVRTSLFANPFKNTSPPQTFQLHIWHRIPIMPISSVVLPIQHTEPTSWVLFQPLSEPPQHSI